MSRKPYPTDLTDQEWNCIAPLLPAAKFGGHPRTTDLREVLNAIFYLNRTGCQWRMLPSEFPAWQTVYAYFARWRNKGVWEAINRTLRQRVRLQAGREADPSLALLDSQSVKSTEKGASRGYDGNKKLKGRKRHIAVDSLGLLLFVFVHAANIHDSQGAVGVLMGMKDQQPRLLTVMADQGYQGPLGEAIERVCGWKLQIVEKQGKGFVVQRQRWVVERTFGWLGRCRRLSKDYEQWPETHEAMVYVSMIRLMLKRLHPPKSEATL
nr:IS5 family transposase [Gloeobacter kilaueensis]